MRLVSHYSKLLADKIPADHEGKRQLTLSIAHIQPIVALLAGILILIMPNLLSYIVAFYLIVTGIIGLGLFH